MLMLLSPAKTLDYESPLTTDQYTLPRMLDDSARLIEVCRQLTAPQLASLMSLSDKLAGLNVARFAQWQPECTADNSRPALFAFKGDVYTGLQAETLSDGDLAFAQTHLRMLSGLYGLLRPCTALGCTALKYSLEARFTTRSSPWAARSSLIRAVMRWPQKA